MSLHNTIWSILSRGRPYMDSQYAYNVDVAAYRAPPAGSPLVAVLDALTPYNEDYLRSIYAEAALKTLLSSHLAERALLFDPVNSYRDGALVREPQGGSVHALSGPSGLQVLTYGTDAQVLRSGRGQVLSECVLNTVAGTFESGGQSSQVTLTSGHTNLLQVAPGVQIRAYVITPGEYLFVHRYFIAPEVDWPTWVASLETALGLRPDIQLNQFLSSVSSWDQRFAACVYWAVEGCLNA